MELSTDNGSDGDDYANTCFNPKAMDSIQAGQAPFSGSFIPEGSWSVFENTPVNGEWNLIVSDGSGQNELGRLISWSITLNTQNEILAITNHPLLNQIYIQKLIPSQQ